ncbi:MAG: hypothetical protein FJ404_12910 [Verrucomicrobia bacterium]|nr:hypothetical protein [Verrucomicrobiota bacterium]
MNRNLIRQRVNGDSSPFVFRLSDGTRVSVVHPDFVAVSPGQVLVISKDESVTRIDPLHIVAIEEAPPEKANQRKIRALKRARSSCHELNALLVSSAGMKDSRSMVLGRRPHERSPCNPKLSVVWRRLPYRRQPVDPAGEERGPSMLSTCLVPFVAPQAGQPAPQQTGLSALPRQPGHRKPLDAPERS